MLRNKLQFLSPLAVSIGLALTASSAAAQVADANTAFMERASLRSADEKCKLLSDKERLALEMGYWQARTALLRGGFSIDEVEALHDESHSYANSKECDDERLTTANERLKDAFLAFSRTPFYEFRGGIRLWTATRTLTDVWAAYQEDPETSVRFGLIHVPRARDPLGFAVPGQKRPPAKLSTVKRLLINQQPPSMARLIVRDNEKSPTPWIGGLFGSSKGLSPPPRSMSKKLLASGREIVDAPPYEDGNKTQGALFLFDDRAMNAVNLLDPRETIIVEFIPSDRDKSSKIVRATFEVGDFRAAAAFSAIARDTVKTN
ncbi:hypothetical protein [Hirschia maritima]|uniref:hypothetical protein n=1 Tax=Hirschia maritima TaxID=1121961 RepID=UPI0003671984|nr:hypothetical protein [Hirschia maritima]